MRILHIIKSLGRGGAETLLPETLQLHDQQQFEFHYIYFLPWKDQMVEALKRHGGIVSCLPANNNIQLILSWRKIIRYVRDHKIELIHCHLPWAGFMGRLIHKLTGIKVIYTEHNKQERYHTITRWINKLTFNSQSAVIAVSADVATSIRKNINVKIPVYEVLNGVNTQTFQRDKEAGRKIKEQLGIPADGKVVGTVAVFRFQKRLKEWLEVFAKASESADNLYGIIVGDGPLKEELLAHRKKLNLEQKVFMPGLQTNVKPWLSAIDIYMMTSVFEGLPIALLEAMSMECAVCTTDAGGIKEVVRDGQDGSLTAVDDVLSMSGKLGLFYDPATLRKYAVASRERVVDRFSMVAMVSQLEELYGNFVNRY